MGISFYRLITLILAMCVSTLRLINPNVFVCVSNDKVDYIITFLLVKSHFIT